MTNLIPEAIRVDARSRFVDLDRLDLAEFPPFEQWTDEDWMDAIHDAPVPIAPGEPHADFRLLQIDCRELALDQYPPLAEWSDVEYDQAVRDTRDARESRGGPLPSDDYLEESIELSTVLINERLCGIDFSLLALDHFPPIAEWHNEHWWEALTITRLEWLSKQEPVDEGEWLTLVEIAADDVVPVD